jgi:hypothetical protein
MKLPIERQGFQISRATQSVWCGDIADLVEPLYELMAERVRRSHLVATDDTILADAERRQDAIGAHVMCTTGIRRFTSIKSMDGVVEPQSGFLCVGV